MIDGNSPAYRQFANAFRRGRNAHVEVRNPAVMQMRTDVPLLAGFARRLRQRSFLSRVDRPPPRPGEHTRQILSELGYQADEIEASVGKAVAPGAETAS